MLRKKADSGWWEGELQAKGHKRQVGWFPASYVKVITIHYYFLFFYVNFTQEDLNEIFWECCAEYILEDMKE